MSDPRRGPRGKRLPRDAKVYRQVNPNNMHGDRPGKRVFILSSEATLSTSNASMETPAQAVEAYRALPLCSTGVITLPVSDFEDVTVSNTNPAGEVWSDPLDPDAWPDDKHKQESHVRVQYNENLSRKKRDKVGRALGTICDGRPGSFTKVP